MSPHTMACMRRSSQKTSLCGQPAQNAGGRGGRSCAACSCEGSSAPKLARMCEGKISPERGSGAAGGSLRSMPMAAMASRK